jgi:hypothetical protein
MGEVQGQEREVDDYHQKSSASPEWARSFCSAAHQEQSDIRADSLRSTGFPHASKFEWMSIQSQFTGDAL